MENIFFKKFREREYRYGIKYANSPRKFALKTALWLLINAFSPAYSARTAPQISGAMRIAVKMSGGVGDMTVNALYVQTLAALDSDCIVDIFGRHEDVLRGIFYKKNFVGKICASRCPRPDDYDAIIDLVRQPRVEYLSPRVESAQGRLAQYLRKIAEFGKKYPNITQTGAMFDYISTAYGRLNGAVRTTQADVLGLLGMRGKKYFMECDPRGARIFQTAKISRPYITVQRGSKTSNDEVKIWPLSNYEKLVAMISKRFPHLEIVQVGRAATHPILGATKDLRGLTDFEELKSILKYSALHIDCECGMVHLKHALGGRSAVIFGPTPIDFYAYSENINISARVCGHCEWLVQDWGRACLRGAQAPVCMTAITPETVFGRIEGALFSVAEDVENIGNGVDYGEVVFG